MTRRKELERISVSGPARQRVVLLGGERRTLDALTITRECPSTGARHSRHYHVYWDADQWVYVTASLHHRVRNSTGCVLNHCYRTTDALIEAIRNAFSFFGEYEVDAA